MRATAIADAITPVQWAGSNMSWPQPNATWHTGAGPAFSTRNAPSRRPASTAGWCRRRRSASISASAWPTASACSGCRCRARSGMTQPIACPDMTLLQRAVHHHLRLARSPSLGWMYTLFFVLLGSSAAIWGGWLERAGPRKAGVVSALCWCGGLVISARRRHHAPALAAVARLRRHRRHRARARLHLAGVDADQMVSRTGAAWRPAWRSWASAAAR